MHQTRRSDVDIVKELRLRRWARENYVAAEFRGPKWHPVVLAEMQIRDNELSTLADDSHAGYRFVPLAPTAIHLLHAAHRHLAGPHIPSRVPARSETADLIG